MAFLLLCLFLDQWGKDSIHGATAGIVRVPLFGGVDFDLFGDLGAASLTHPSVPLPISIDDVGLPR
jgi:hypothetical protein